MSLAFCSMTSRSARLSLSEQQKSVLLNDVISALDNTEHRKDVTVYSFQNLKVVVEIGAQLIKIMTEHEYRRLYPTLTSSKNIATPNQKVA